MPDARFIGDWISIRDASSGENTLRPVPTTPSRGRQFVTLSADGTATIKRPGRSDRAEEMKGTWTAEGDDVVIDVEGRIEKYKVDAP